MSAELILLIVLVVLAAGVLLSQLAMLARGRADPALREKLDALRSDGQRLDQTLRDEQRAGRAELAQSLDRLGERLQKTLGELADGNEKRLGEVRATLETKLKALQDDNAAQLDRMRATVDEKLQSSLQERFNKSFGMISERLEAVQRGLGEMQTLATGVGDLKRVLSNVKTRGTFGEVQLGALLEQLLSAEQYAANVATVPGSNERVEYAIRLPGRDGDAPVWLPIDAKFPIEDHQRLLDAQERADPDAAAQAAAALERRVRDEAKTIHAKYVAPPSTTDFAILFLPTEGLYAEVIRRPGLFEALQRDWRVTVAGPTTLTAILNALQMGFRTLAIEKRSSEVWQILGAVKTEFGKFGAIVDKAKNQLDSARNNLDELVGRRSRAIERKLRGVESLPDDASHALLGDTPPGNGEDEDPD
ncbi:MAG: DNA recombination protein RmuC [Xanthomonadales bacterium]|nr:DNA recombination protein RmuC [Xanthomonadales bacterium]ODU91860.1 MAG: recombinase RmuC [Rhodanobacter sp. SCN 66-43]OJY84838.1 MAG: recombinase RmuC [Xanthomonadales bacterium 66-474]